MATMTSNRPYLISAFYDWIVDNNLTPYLLVNAYYPGVEVPQEFVNGGRIVLNISPDSVRGLHLGHDRIVFTTRFSGQSTQISLSPGAVLAIYTKENGRGMEFTEEYEEPPETVAPPKDKGRSKPVLTLVKQDKNSED